MRGHPTTVLGHVQTEATLVITDGDDSLIAADVESLVTLGKAPRSYRRCFMMAPRVAVLFGFGINCDHETKAVFEMVGAQAERIHVNRFVSGDADLSTYDILAVPGGFSFGDHLGSGRLLGNRMRFAMRESLMSFVNAGKPIIGICNGFQVLVKTGLLPGPDTGRSPDFLQRGSLTLNDSGRYEDRWVRWSSTQSPCIWTKGMDRIECPVRHGEGKYVMPSSEDLDRLSNTIN